MLKQTGIIVLAATGLLAAKISSMQAPLFVIERSTNANVVHYDANVGPNGQLDPREPVTAYWIMAAADGHREELTSLEKSKAYGFSVEAGADPDTFRLRLVAQKHREIAIVRQGSAVRAEALIDGRRAWLKKMYVSTHKLFPTVKYIEFFGSDLATGESVSERFIP